MRSGAPSRDGGTGTAAKVLLAETSPYGSRRLTVETDGVTTAAYLRDAQDGVIGASWIANHQPAAPGLDLSRLNAGLTPVMPAGRTRHPDGRPALDPRSLEIVWFEEGDGAAVLESGEPLCVIPAWSDMSRGIPGYSRDVNAQSPFAFPLEQEIAEFSPRIQQARAFWEWCRQEGAWAEFQQSVLGHLLNRLGPGGHYWHDVGRQFRGPGAAQKGERANAPVVSVSERPARTGRDFSVLSTLGMSRQRMPTVELYEDDVSHYARIELAVASTLPSQRVGSIFPWLAQYPWRSVTWFAPGDVVKWYHEAKTFPLNGPDAEDARWAGVLLLDDPSRLAGPPAPDLTGFTFDGDPVRWLWLVPITDEERRYAKAEGSNALVRRLRGEGRSWVVS
ncbi:Suppressor of fused protein (SUFU) [Thermomonospora echinospora]|uniref:Suppressor of fused protein (SUFU) n=1 Tax=Thermomonospora echinospora TaxID=1992 RepID=A0A1H6DQU9_9ACTN|nr:suppressor of fused domain protein [Thermomonospora echinospora]SEG86965.1 Suppressor of fused protein (SUFU) [Thermomonospora echinospora]